LELFEISGQVVLKKFCKNFKCMRIIVIALGGLGDILMTTPMIKVLRSAYPKAKIDTITMLPSSYEILKNNPNLNNVIYYPFLKEGYSRSLFFLLKNFSFKRGFYDVSITLYPSYPKHYHIVSYLVGAKKRIATRFKKGYLKECFFLYTDLVEAKEDKHHVINNLNLLRPLGIKISEEEAQKLDLEIYLEKPSTRCEEFLANTKSPFIFIHNGSFLSKKGSEKRRLILVQVISLIESIINRNLNVVFNIGPEEVAQKKVIAEKLHYLINKKVFLCQNFPLNDVSHIIKNAYKVISTDSGIHHLAAALKKEIILILGLTDERKIYPWNARYHIISAPVPCRPCYLSYAQREFVCKNKNEKWACIKRIDVRKIVELI